MVLVALHVEWFWMSCMFSFLFADPCCIAICIPVYMPWRDPSRCRALYGLC